MGALKEGAAIYKRSWMTASHFPGRERKGLDECRRKAGQLKDAFGSGGDANGSELAGGERRGSAAVQNLAEYDQSREAALTECLWRTAKPPTKWSLYPGLR